MNSPILGTRIESDHAEPTNNFGFIINLRDWLLLSSHSGNTFIDVSFSSLTLALIKRKDYSEEMLCQEWMSQNCFFQRQRVPSPSTVSYFASWVKLGSIWGKPQREPVTLEDCLTNWQGTCLTFNLCLFLVFKLLCSIVCLFFMTDHLFSSLQI